ncbi:ribosome silencing factor [Anaeromyxobacter sp. Fw109-5]|uniref:ribosome silencing factor n=1 Tax=Anaeromyxobacter sp. (strain Fw109-5) TaxID=404589 RepID=UPI0000ED782F|nr:ribosome silencing factor [Anaeromyxobacter sp. Fw109-5]ABS24446.1 iojap-like protein [Anaeromyxobacter sp. Fw109-5]
MAIKKKATAKKTAKKTKPLKKTARSRQAPARGGKELARRRGPAPVSQALKRVPRAAKKPAASAGGPVSAAPAAAPQPDHARPTALAIAHAGLDKKAEEVTVLDVRGLTSYADYFVVMTADSDRQASAIADHVEQTMKAQGVSKVGVEGYETGRWILVDYGDVVAHVMNRESRGFYDLEGLWADAPRFAVEG